MSIRTGTPSSSGERHTAPVDFTQDVIAIETESSALLALFIAFIILNFSVRNLN